MNINTADGEHDGKISYKIYEYEPSVNTPFDTLRPGLDYEDYFLVGERTSQVNYSSDDTVDDRKEASMDDLVECIIERSDSSVTLESIEDVFTKAEDYHGENAIVDLLEKYGGFSKNTTLTTFDTINDLDKGIKIRSYADYHYEELASINPNIIDGKFRVTVVNPSTDSGWNKYSGYFVIDIACLFNKSTSYSNSHRYFGYPIQSGKIVCDSMPTEKELIQIIIDNYDIIFKSKTKDSSPIYPTATSLDSIARDKRKP